MPDIRVVIGANFGDEGKGLFTDTYASEAGKDALVVRFNGGAQAGHTVIAPNGRRHVFKHVGAGAFSGAATLLSRDFLVNPKVFMRERAQLAAVGVDPVVYVDAGARVTTPFDMLLNEAVEEARGINRHGSVGYGINETVKRSEVPEYAIIVDELFDTVRLRRKLVDIRDFWMNARCVVHGFPNACESRRDIIQSEGLLDRWMYDVANFLTKVTPSHDVEVLTQARWKTVVFEGAQGLLLDAERGAFPHVTNSRTGLFNVVKLLRESSYRELEVCYATRSYLTRHGAGPLANELPGKPWPSVYDQTNIHGPWQGSLRFAYLDVCSLSERIATDLTDAVDFDVALTVGVSCLDQFPEKGEWWEDTTVYSGTPDDLMQAVGSTTAADTMLFSVGPTREFVHDYPEGMLV